jgi:hypothetical protein
VRYFKLKITGCKALSFGDFAPFEPYRKLVRWRRDPFDMAQKGLLEPYKFQA